MFLISRSLQRSSKLVAMACLLLLPFITSAKDLTLEDFSKRVEFYNAKISPDGKHLATLVNNEGSKSLMFFDMKTMKPIYNLPASKKTQAGNFYWANNERVVLQLEKLMGALDAPVNAGEIFAVNFNGKKARMLFGLSAAATQAGEAGQIIDLLPDDEKNILILKTSLIKNSKYMPTIAKLNIYNGRLKTVKKLPLKDSGVLTDNDGVPRFAFGVDDDFNTKLFYREGKGKNWESLTDNFKGKFSPVSFGKDNKSVYGLRDIDGAPEELIKIDIDTKAIEVIHASERVTPTSILSTSLNDVYAMRMDEDYPSYVYIDKKSRDAQLHNALFKAFKYQKLAITSRTDDGKNLIVHVSGDTNPGIFYLFDTEKMSTKPLFKAARWIDEKQMAKMEPIRFKSKDGLELNGYLTVPLGKKENLPLVVMPHGGPHARDYWGYDPTVQMLAHAGYAVVQVNFRGSTGYGEKFMEAGYTEWGNAIQEDIYLAAKYAIETGVADKDRVCIYGASFGGYSALQSAVKYPDFYKCAIGFVGVYDLPLLYNTGDITDRRWGDAYLDKTLGTDEASQIAQSPVHNLDKLKAPVFIIHGKKDHRAAYEHAEVLRDALEKQNHPYEWLVKDKEGHGFYKEENNLEKNQKVLKFLDKYIGE